jgi:hypothetical protein
MRRAALPLALLACALLAPDARAQSFRTGAVSTILDAHPNTTCGGLTTWYGPTVLTYPNGDLGFLAQTGRFPGSSCPFTSPIDDFYSARRSVSTGNWTVPGTSSCPTLKGGYSRCAFGYPNNPGPIGNPSVVQVGSKYYMAFSGGNADFIIGRIYWAVSSNGVNWSVYDVNPPTGEVWTPLVAPAYHECAPVGHAGGIAEVKLAYAPGDTSMGQKGTFYIYFSNWGLRPDLGAGGSALDNWAVRFAYSPGSPFDIGTSQQLWHRTNQNDGTWKSFDSGLMVWDFDVAQGLPAIPAEPVVSAYHGHNLAGPFRFGAGELRRDPISGKWLHLYTFGGVTKTQTASSLAANLWSAPATVDDTTLRDLVPAGTDPARASPYESGLHYGAIGDRTGLWMFAPVNYLGCSSAYLGLGIAPTELCTGAAPTVSSVSPGSGPTTGGTVVTLSGSNLDCASAVTFGGTPATFVSRSPNQVRVTAPAHAAVTVNVSLTTPSGTATKTSAFTYSGPPAFGGFHEAINCHSTRGWAWDANQPTTPITVDVYDGSTKIGSATANLFRQNLLDAGIGDGRHGFGFNLPASVRSGASHSISVRYGGTSTNLGATPKSIDCRSLSITKSGIGTGTVTSSPAGIQCGATCSRWFPRNGAVALSATPDAGFSFAGWSGHSDCADGSVTLSANRSCTASFDSSADAHLIWLQPQAMAGFGPPGSLVMAGSATGAAAGSRVEVMWRNVSTSGPWVTESYRPLPNTNGIWYQSVPYANYSQQYEVRVTYAGITWPSCTYPGSGTVHWCP